MYNMHFYCHFTKALDKTMKHGIKQYYNAYDKTICMFITLRIDAPQIDCG
jgi:hypothetical protein